MDKRKSREAEIVLDSPSEGSSWWGRGGVSDVRTEHQHQAMNARWMHRDDNWVVI